MKIFREYYLKVIALVLYFWMALPWALSQPSDVVTSLGFLSLAVVVYFIIAEIVKIVKKIDS